MFKVLAIVLGCAILSGCNEYISYDTYQSYHRRCEEFGLKGVDKTVRASGDVKVYDVICQDSLGRDWTQTQMSKK